MEGLLLSLGRKVKVILDGIENFLYVDEEETLETEERKTTKKKKPARQQQQQTKQQQSPNKKNNLGWLIVLDQTQTTINLRCRSGKLHQLADILTKLQAQYQQIKIVPQWTYNQQPIRNWVAFDIKFWGGTKLNEKVRARIYDDFILAVQEVDNNTRKK